MTQTNTALTSLGFCDERNESESPAQTASSGAAEDGRAQRWRKPRPLTGRTVLICLVAFFAVVAGVNAIMIRFAVSTFGGVETGSAYRAGLEFKNEIAAAERQDARHWQIAAHAVRDADGRAVLSVNAADEKGAPLSGVGATVRLAHPTNARLDRTVALAETAAGRFKGMIEAPAGQWTLIIDLTRGEERMFRSRSRIVLK
jgi:nitrogen fixation protein FixH